MLDNKANMYVEEDDIVELMLQNRQVKILPRDVTSFKTFDDTCKTFGIKNPFELTEPMEGVLNWNMPDEYKDICIRDYILENNKLNLMQIVRVDMELMEFEQRGLNDLLRFLIYFVKILKEHNIVYGVGRGSSVASYVLYLIGVHRIDSFKFNLDIKEFLK